MALTFDVLAQSTQVHVDGRVEGSATLRGRLRSSSGWLQFGGYEYGDGRCCFLEADVDEVRVYPRALAASQLSALASCSRADDCGVPGAAGAWSFEDDGAERSGRFPVERHRTFRAASPTYVTGRVGRGVHFDDVDQYAATRVYEGTLPLTVLWDGCWYGELADEPSDPSYCHAVTDIDLWVLSGMVELLAARRLAPDVVALDAADEARLQAALAPGLRLVERGLEPTALTDRAGRAALGLVFESSAWSEHPEFEYSGYEGARFPTPADRRVAPRHGWDISHATRYVPVFFSLHENRAVLGGTFPSRAVLEGLANQFAYRIFGGTPSRPRFRNFYGGANGWYRVNYDGRAGFGYEPWDLSAAAIDGGYGFWSPYNPDVSPMMESLWAMIQSTDPAVVAFRDQHYDRYWSMGARAGGLDAGSQRAYALLTFLPVFAQAR